MRLSEPHPYALPSDLFRGPRASSTCCWSISVTGRTELKPRSLASRQLSKRSGVLSIASSPSPLNPAQSVSGWPYPRPESRDLTLPE